MKGKPLARLQFPPRGAGRSLVATEHPHQLLALEVIRSAIVDAQQGDPEALQWLLEPSPSREVFARAAGVKPARLPEAAQRHGVV